MSKSCMGKFNGSEGHMWYSAEEHGRCSNDHIFDSPQHGSQGRGGRGLPTQEESADNLSNTMSGYRGEGVGGKDHMWSAH
jgi:hypothetical protein